MPAGRTLKEVKSSFESVFGMASNKADEFARKYISDYQRSVTFKNVYPGTYDIEIRACIFCSDELATTLNGSIMQVSVNVGAVSLPVTYFKVTANTSGSTTNIVSFGFYEKIEVASLTNVQAVVKLMDTNLKAAKDLSIDDETTIGFTLHYVDKT